MDWGLFTKSNLQQWCVYLAVYEAATGWNKRHDKLMLERFWRVRYASPVIYYETRKFDFTEVFTGTIKSGEGRRLRFCLSDKKTR